MKITKVMVNRKFNLGNYESIDVAAEAELSEKDTAFEVWSILKDNADNWFMESKKPKPVQVPPSVAPSPVTPKDDSLVCACGAPKKASFKQCYSCWEKKAAK
jgi:hypothetical protein